MIDHLHSSRVDNAVDDTHIPLVKIFTRVVSLRVFDMRYSFLID